MGLRPNPHNHLSAQTVSLSSRKYHRVPDISHCSPVNWDPRSRRVSVVPSRSTFLYPFRANKQQTPNRNHILSSIPRNRIGENFPSLLQVATESNSASGYNWGQLWVWLSIIYQVGVRNLLEALFAHGFLCLFWDEQKSRTSLWIPLSLTVPIPSRITCSKHEWVLLLMSIVISYPYYLLRRLLVQTWDLSLPDSQEYRYSVPLFLSASTIQEYLAA